jgi:glycosyltransferase involved in cell wall biosynthesis
VHVLAAETAAAVEPDGALGVPLTRCWREDGRDPLQRLGQEIARGDFETVVIQFNYSFYDFESLGRLIHELKEAGRQVVVMMHGTDDARAPADRQVGEIAGALARCDRLIVHKIADMERLRALGLEANVALMPHGVLPVEDLPAPPPLEGRELTLGSYGFLLPNKGIPELIEAVALLRAGGRHVNLALMTAEYPREMSRTLLERCYGEILARGMAPFVRLDARFRPDAEVLADLARCDLLVFPYQQSAESASGAVRYGLAAGRPVAVTPLDIFSDVADMTLRLPGRTPGAMAEGLASAIDRIRAGETFPDLRRRARAECDRLAYTRLAPRLGNILISLKANRM